MKKKILLAVFALVALTMQAQVDVSVSETVELMSILSRTASFDEYNMDMGGQYTEDTEQWFAPFKAHPAVTYFRGLRGQYGISHNAPADLAVNLTIENGHVKMATSNECLNDPRWQDVDVDELVTLIDQFYTDTRFHEFYQQHQDFYNEVLSVFNTNVMPLFDQEWYPRFYGIGPAESFHVIIGFTTGGHNYATSRQIPGQPKENFSVIGYWIYPQYGMGFEGENARRFAAPTVIHEFNHSFVNYLIEDENNAKLLGDIPERLLGQERFMLSRVQAYPESKTVFNETVVRAATAIYLMENGFTDDEVKQDIMSNMQSGFPWTPEMVSAMRYYTTHRDMYPTLNDYYPEIAKTLKNYLDAQPAIDLAVGQKLKNQAQTASSSNKAEVMETVELMSALSIAAGFDEYISHASDAYNQDLEQLLAPFKQHPVIGYYQGLRQQYHISYDAPMSLAVRLAVKKGKIVMLPEEQSAEGNGLDDRWKNVNMPEFLGLLNQFYTDTRFHEFYQQHQQLYQQELKNYNEKIMPYVYPEWFSGFYGNGQNDRYKVVIAFAGGIQGYGATCQLKGQPWDRFFITGKDTYNYENPSEKGNHIISFFNRFYPQTVLNDEAYNATLRPIAEKLSSQNPRLMQMFGFRDASGVMSQSLENASNIIHMLQNGCADDEVNMQLDNDVSMGFKWERELVKTLCEYAINRNKYQSLADFYPQIANALNQFCDNEEKREAEVQQRINNALR